MARNEEGFGLIELLVVVGIVGILAAIAIPSYAGYKTSAVDGVVASDLRSARNAMEAFYIESEASYAGADVNALEVHGFRSTAAVDLRIVSATDAAYVLRGCSTGTSAASFVYDSDVGKTLPDAGTC